MLIDVYGDFPMCAVKRVKSLDITVIVVDKDLILQYETERRSVGAVF